ncbi:MAG: sugar transferase [Bacteroidales bacterium]|nr:sugar transferase [Bacteroidales bacterium]
MENKSDMNPMPPHNTPAPDGSAPQRPMRSLRRPLLQGIYIAGDWLAAAVAWVLFFAFRKHTEGVAFDRLDDALLQDPTFFRSLLLIPLFWCLWHSLFGYYHHIYRKTYTLDLSQSLKACFSGTLLLFFLIILDDYIARYTDYYIYGVALFATYFPLCLLTRWGLTRHIRRQLRRGRIGFNTLIVGDGPAARHFVAQLRRKNPDGLCLKGYIPIQTPAASEPFPLPRLGDLDDIEQTLHGLTVEEVFVFPETGEENALPLILSQCLAPHLIVHIRPSTENILLGAVRHYSLQSDPFIRLSFDRMPFWQRCIRRGFEIVACTVAGLLLSPLLVYAACRVRRSSPGPVLYKQERLGLHGKPFDIYKFRSMYVNAETDRPLLASDHDARITPWGRIMRKYRIDELPQLYNVLKGDMALVGPRPERAYFVEQIVRSAPHYRLLFNVKPGLTSWGETQYGYAENVPEMIERLAYDMVYLENQSLTMDLKILLYTIGVVFKGEGQ